MRKLFLQLQGYEQIDEVYAEWELVQYNVQGEVISSVEYSIYYIFYNSKKDKYTMLTGGFRPFHNNMHTELASMINFLNKKPVHEKLQFWRNSQDYFIQKSKLDDLIKQGYDMDLMSPPQEENKAEMLNKVRVVRIELNQYKEHLDKIQQDDPKLIKTMQDFKKNVLQKKERLDIWQDLGNVIITSEGCYFSIYNKNLRFDEGPIEE